VSRDNPTTTADVAVTGRARRLDLSEADRAQGRITDAVIAGRRPDPPKLELPDRHS
jgi:hypothetical protein